MGLGGIQTADDEWPTHDLLSHRLESTPDRELVVDAETGERWTVREFDEHVTRVATHLRSLAAFDTSDEKGVEGNTPAGGRVAVLLAPSPSFAAVFFATTRLGATLVALNTRETAPELEAKLERTKPDLLVCDASTERLALESVADLGRAAPPVVSVDEPRAGEVVPISRESGGGFPGKSVTPARIDPGSTQVIMFTSGTTGEPKGVQLTMRNLVSSATGSAFRLGVSPDDRWLCCLPMYHMGGLAPLVRSTLYGTRVVIQREFDPEETARVLDESEITGVSLVPTMLTRLLDAGWSPSRSLRFVLLGGAPATAELLERAREAGVPVYPTYGMTETASQIATATPAQVETHTGTVGQPLVVTSVTVVDDDGVAVPPGETGELVVDGPTVTPGYLDPERTAAAFGEHGFHTGDMGHRDSDGYLWVHDRRADRIVSGGENVDPTEVEDCLEAHSSVSEVTVVGLPDDEWGQRVSALVVPAESVVEGAETRHRLESILEHCDRRLAGYKRPRTIGFVEELPRTHSGTIDREAVRNRLETDEPRVFDDR